MRQDLNNDVVPARLTLAQASPGDRYTVLAVRGEDLLADRLLAAGLWPGALVESLGRAPFGDPLLFKLHGFRLALRRAEAERVAVAPMAGAAMSANPRLANPVLGAAGKVL